MSIEIRGLTHIYMPGTPFETRALDDVSFSVAEGEFCAIVGSSGSGKSTLLHLMGGVDRPTSGTVRLNGEDIYARSDEELAVFRRRKAGKCLLVRLFLFVCLSPFKFLLHCRIARLRALSGHHFPPVGKRTRAFFSLYCKGKTGTALFVARRATQTKRRTQRMPRGTGKGFN